MNASIAAEQTGEFDKAHIWLDEALRRDPQCVPAYLARHSLYLLQGERTAAATAIFDGLAIAPDNHDLLFGLAGLRLAEGDYAGGWEDYEHRPTKLQLNAALDEYREWQGEPIEGKTILVAREQGIGDGIMFARCLPRLRAAGARVVLYTYPELARLLAPLADQVVSCDADVPEFDVWAAIGSLPRLLHFAPDLASSEPYLLSDSDRVEEFRQLLEPAEGRLRVGVRWRGSAQHRWDACRSFTLEDLRPLLGFSHCQFVSLQYDETDSGLFNLSRCCHDFADTAAAIAALDLVITCDTAIAHLAGALGKPVWILLGQPSDWRWGLASAKTPWYRSATLIRSKIAQDWSWPVNYATAMLHGLRRVWGEFSPPSTGPARDPVVCGTTRYGTQAWLRNDHYVGRALDLYGEYSESEVDLLRKVLKPGDTVLDIGANVGGLAYPLAEIVGPKGLVYAAEPQPVYCQCLRRFAPPNVAIWEAAFGKENKPLTLRTIELRAIHAPGWESTGPPFVVPQRRIDDQGLEACALIKIDVDGQEMEILQGAEQTIARFRPFLYVENDKPQKCPDLLPWLDAHGYRVYQHYARLYNPHNYRSNPVNVFGNIVSAMLLCVPQERRGIHPQEWGISRLKITRKAE